MCSSSRQKTLRRSRTPALSARRRRKKRQRRPFVSATAGTQTSKTLDARFRGHERKRRGKMRIVVHGQQAFGKAVLEALLKRGDNVIAVYVAPEKEGAKADPLKEAAIAAKLPVYQPASYKDPKVWEEFKALKPDLQVMAFVTLFVPEDFLNIPTHGSIQYHPSLLPAYRGASAINWPIIKGEKETGLSIFWPDNGLDTGDILVQKKTPISGTDTLGTVYFDRLFPMGVEAMLEGDDLVKAGRGPGVKQDESKGTYEGRCTPENAKIDWGKPWEQIDRLIRGCNPAPGAWTTFDGKQLRIFDAMPIPAKDPKGIGGKLGETAAGEGDGFTVACADGRFKFTRVQPADGKKIDAGEWAKPANIAAKARFTCRPVVMPGLGLGIHFFQQQRRGWPGRARP